MKKKLLVLLSAVVMVVGLAGCGGAATEICDFCNEDKVCETRDMLGEEVKICEDCITELEDLMY